jgi:hypothetical protein
LVDEQFYGTSSVRVVTSLVEYRLELFLSGWMPKKPFYQGLSPFSSEETRGLASMGLIVAERVYLCQRQPVRIILPLKSIGPARL